MSTPKQSAVGPQQPAWKLVYSGQDITQSIESMVTEVRYCDRLDVEAPDMSFTVEDSRRLWQGPWLPGITDTIQLSIGYRGAALLDCGTFTIDAFDLGGPPDAMTVRAVRSWITAPIRTRGSYAYEGQTLSQIAQTIAAKHGWTADTAAVSPDVVYHRHTQDLEAHSDDMAFLRELADDANYIFAVRPPKLIFYNRSELESAPPVATLTRKALTRFRFTQQAIEERTFTGAQFSYFDPSTKQLYSAQAKATGTLPTAADTLNMRGRVENNQQAALRAAAALHESNILTLQGELEMPGTIAYRSGQTIQLDDFGALAGKFIIEEAEHTLRAGFGGYRTKLTIRTAVAGVQLVPGGAAGSTP